MEIEYDKNQIISKIEYNFILEEITKNDNDNSIPILNQYEIIIENYSNKTLIIKLYEITNDLTIIKYSNILSLEYFINQSTFIKCLSLMSKKPYTIKNIYKLIKDKLDDEKIKNNNNIIYKKKFTNFKIIKSNKKENQNKNDNIYIHIYILLCNFKKEKIILELNKIKTYSNKKQNIPKIINELLEQNYNMIDDINNMESDLQYLSESKINFLTTLKKCDAYYGQSIKMKMDFMDKGIDSDIFKSKEDYDFIVYNISKRINKKIKEIKQIFKASSNGDNINAFHDSCLYIQNILVLILSDEKKCFGGFTQAEFDNNNRYKYDENAFLFSINNKEIYPILNRYKKMAINCYDDLYISVFGNDIYICDCFFSNNGNITQEGFYDYSNSKI